MRVLGQYMAALLVVTVVMPGIAGFGWCCEHKPSTAAIAMYDHCGQEQIQEASPASHSLLARGCQCRFCPSLLAKRVEQQAPTFISTVSLQPTIAVTKLSPVQPPRLDFNEDPPPEDSSVRRAVLCTFLV